MNGQFLVAITFIFYVQAFEAFADGGTIYRYRDNATGIMISVGDVCQGYDETTKKTCIQKCSGIMKDANALRNCANQLEIPKAPTNSSSSKATKARKETPPKPGSNASRKECAGINNEKDKNVCIQSCARHNTDDAVKKCVSLFSSEYQWVEDVNSRKIITSSVACGGGKICIGTVKYQKGERTLNRLAVCGVENCGDEDATACARQSGYGSESVAEFIAKSTSDRNQKRTDGGATAAQE